MTRTQFTDARRNVKKQLVSWTSIVVIGMVALVAYLSLVYSSEAIRHAASGFFDAYKLWDLEISSSLLLDEDGVTLLVIIFGDLDKLELRVLEFLREPVADLIRDPVLQVL